MQIRIAISLLIAFVLGGAADADTVAGQERGVPLEAALKAADKAAGFKEGRPKELDVVTVKLVPSHTFDVDAEGLSSRLKDMKTFSPSRPFWFIVYRRWPPRLDDDLVVFIDAKTGDTIRVFRWGKPDNRREK